MNTLWAICALVLTIGIAPFVQAKSLTLEDALQLAVEKSPNIKGAEADYAAAKGDRRQASAFLNPILQFDAENLAGSGQYNGMDSAELTAGVSQLIEIGGKRSARIQAADHGKVIARYGQSSTKFDLIRDVKTAFANAVDAQEEAAIAEEQAQLARDVYATVNKRVTAAAEPLVQRNKARISVINAELVAANAKGKKNSTLRILLSLWSSTESNVTLSTDDFYKMVKPDIEQNALNKLQHSVDYRQQTANLEQAKSFLDLEKANAVPDPSFNIGVRDFRSGNDQALVAGVSIPLPVFNVNGGNIEKARQIAVKADTDRQKLLLSNQASLIEHLQELQNSYLTASKIKIDVLPEAKEAFKQAERGYKAGKFAYLEVLDAQRTLTDTRLSYVQALRDYHIHQAEVDRLTAQDFPMGEK